MLKTMKLRPKVLGAGLFACALLMAGQVEAASSPNGPSALNETYQNWQVSCVMQEETSKCAMSQIQADPETRKRVIAFELHLTDVGTKGSLIAPFGLDLPEGLNLKVDDGDTLVSLPFSTCLPAGCLVSSVFSAEQLAKLQTGSDLLVGAYASGSKQALNFTISLNGFSAALARLQQLNKR